MKNIRKIIYVPLLLLALIACDDDDDKSLNTNDKNFTEQAALGNMAEIELATLAVTKATDQSVRSFANHMITEHTQAQSELRQIGDEFDNINWPNGLDAEHAQKKQQLQGLSGLSFDSTYMRSQVKDHAVTVALFQNEQNNGSEDRLKQYAAKYLPHIQEHYTTATNLLNQLKQPD